MAQVRTVLLWSVQNIPSSSSICTGFTLSPFSPSQLPLRAPALFCPCAFPPSLGSTYDFFRNNFFWRGVAFPVGFTSVHSLVLSLFPQPTPPIPFGTSAKSCRWVPAPCAAAGSAHSQFPSASLGSARSSRQQSVPPAAALGGFQAAAGKNIPIFWRSEVLVLRG